jgi:hypothetical protein
VSCNPNHSCTHTLTHSLTLTYSLTLARFGKHAKEDDERKRKIHAQMAPFVDWLKNAEEESEDESEEEESEEDD